uniref:Dual oxidase maturation factor 1 n=1 Tax=Chelonoidis abingdonii TaxID=106734 RepID=A0A8C0GFV3_CHEAB
MTLFDGSFPFYPNTRMPFPFNTTLVLIISVFVSVLAMFILILPGIRGKGRFFWLLRVVTSLFIGAVILRNPVNQINETINYNEHFAWHLGADYTRIYADSLVKGLPSPILYVAEKFSQHSPCGVHNRYRISGHYTSVTLWLAFCTWLISNMLFSMPILLYGSCMILLTAALLICSLLFFSVARNSPMCTIRFGPASLQTVYGASFWLTLATGLLCFLLGLGVIVLNSVQPEKLKLVFNLSEEGREKEEEEGPVQLSLRDKASSSEQDMLLAPLSEHCKVMVTQL